MSPLARIIDANANRAREALRVMEDAARFALNNPALSSTLKHLRHDLQAAMDLLPLNRLDHLASRDTPTDVGTTIKTDSEHTRTDLPAITAAAASRLTEALIPRRGVQGPRIGVPRATELAPVHFRNRRPNMARSVSSRRNSFRAPPLSRLHRRQRN